jgi:hypothetical protein
MSAIERERAFAGRVVQVSISPEIAYDAKKMQKVTATLLGRLGCPGCHSGFDIRYKQMLDFVVNPKSLELEVAGFEKLGAGR